MMRTNYEIAFSVEVFHTYFGQGICNCFVFHPGEATRRLMKRFGFKIRNRMNGFDVYADTDNTLAACFQYIRQTTFEDFFDFEMHTTYADFNLFTEMPADWVGRFLYSSRNPGNTNENGHFKLQADLSKQQEATATGSIQLYFDDIVSCGNKNTHAHFEISFTARETQWQYYVINRSSLPLDQPFINGKKEIHFDGPVSVSIPNGEEALLFTSASKLIPFRKTPPYQFDLVNGTVNDDKNNTTFLSAGKILYKGLPVPDPGRTHFAELNGQQIFSSPMYVYI